MGKSFDASSLGLKTSSAYRRLQDGRGRGRAAWREAKAASNGVYARHVAEQTAQPRLIRRTLEALPMSAFLDSAVSC